jgi:hypothetical protein
VAAPDPGGVFQSDAHRRTLAHLDVPGGEPMQTDALFDRMRSDVGTDFADEAELSEVLDDLEADGYAGLTTAGWKQTKRGAAALVAPPGGEE